MGQPVPWQHRAHGGFTKPRGDVVGATSFYFPTALPVGDTDLFSMEVTSLANGCVLRYITASQKLGLKIGTGTEQVSDAVVTFGQWIGVDVYYDPRTTTHTCAWQVDYNATLDDPTAPVAQTTASTASMTAGNVTKVRHGWTQAVTRTVRYDDLVGSRHRKTGLIGDIKIFPLGVDPAGTPTRRAPSATSARTPPTAPSPRGRPSTPATSSMRSRSSSAPAPTG